MSFSQSWTAALEKDYWAWPMRKTATCNIHGVVANRTIIPIDLSNVVWPCSKCSSTYPQTFLRIVWGPASTPIASRRVKELYLQ
jgi:hypothetical protein